MSFVNEVVNDLMEKLIDRAAKDNVEFTVKVDPEGITITVIPPEDMQTGGKE